MLKSLLSVTALKLIGLFASFVILLVLSRFYGASVVGGYSILMTMLTLGGLIVGFGMPESILRDSAAWYSKLQVNKISQECFKLFLVCLINALFFWFLLPFLLSFYTSEPYLSVVLSAQNLIALTALFLALSHILANVLRGVDSPKLGVFLRETVSPLITLLLVFFLSIYFNLQENSEPLEMSWVLFFVTTLALVFSLLSYHKKIGLGLSFKVSSFHGFHRYWLKSLPFVLLSVVVWGNNSVDILMLGAMSGAQEAGRYTISARLASVIGLIIIISNNILAPKFTQYYVSEQLDKFKQLARKATFYLGVGAIFAFAGAFVLGGFVLRVFGEQFANDHTLLLMLCFAQTINVLVGPVGYLIIAAGKEKVIGIYSMFALLLNVLLNYFLIQSYQAMGAALATSISLILLNIFCLLYVKTQLGFFTMSAWLHWQTMKLYTLEAKQQIWQLFGLKEMKS
jgi:O-antigen/teichoic acid export membrane protein